MQQLPFSWSTPTYAVSADNANHASNTTHGDSVTAVESYNQQQQQQQMNASEMERQYNLHWSQKTAAAADAMSYYGHTPTAAAAAVTAGVSAAASDPLSMSVLQSDLPTALPTAVPGYGMSYSLPVSLTSQSGMTMGAPVRAAAEDGTSVCRYWLQGECRYGNMCRNLHTTDLPESLPECHSTTQPPQQLQSLPAITVASEGFTCTSTHGNSTTSATATTDTNPLTLDSTLAAATAAAGVTTGGNDSHVSLDSSSRITREGEQSHPQPALTHTLTHAYPPALIQGSSYPPYTQSPLLQSQSQQPLQSQQQVSYPYPAPLLPSSASILSCTPTSASAATSCSSSQSSDQYYEWLLIDALNAAPPHWVRSCTEAVIV